MTALGLPQIVERALAEVGAEPCLMHSPRGRPRVTVWLGREPGFGVRQYASGRQVYIAQVRMGGRMRTVTLGTTVVLTRHQAETVARQVIAWARIGDDPASERRRIRKIPAFDDFLEVYWRRCSPKWKASTCTTNGEYRRNYLDHAFPGQLVDQIEEADIVRWFTRTTDRAGPGGANRCFSILKAAFYRAERWGYRADGTNPCRAIKPNRSRVCERSLSGEELARLGRVLDSARQGVDPYRSICASAVLLLVLTGCRSSEIMNAEWQDIRCNRLRLRDSKTGPRTVWLGADARKIIDELPRFKGVPYLFWNPLYAKHIRTPFDAWCRFRDEAGLPGVRLHDLRHSFASHAAMNAETLPMISRLLGHAFIGSTARYAHHDDAHLLDAAQKIGNMIDDMMTCGVAGEEGDAAMRRGGRVISSHNKVQPNRATAIGFDDLHAAWKNGPTLALGARGV